MNLYPEKLSNSPTISEPTIRSEQVNVSGVTRVFGWTLIDNIPIPYLIRDKRKYVSVRIVDLKLLSQYPSSICTALGTQAPVAGYFITANEANLLNEINMVHCNRQFGDKEFTARDLIVELSGFYIFYGKVRAYYQKHIKQQATNAKGKQPTLTRDCMIPSLPKIGGWMQINNTVIPYIRRMNDTFLPLSVIRYAVGLLMNIEVNVSIMTNSEHRALTTMCREAGLLFHFSVKTPMITLTELSRHCPVHIRELPFDNPLSCAKYVDTLGPCICEPVKSTRVENGATMFPVVVSTYTPLTTAHQSYPQKHTNQRPCCPPNAILQSHRTNRGSQPDHVQVETPIPPNDQHVQPTLNNTISEQHKDSRYFLHLQDNAGLDVVTVDPESGPITSHEPEVIPLTDDVDSQSSPGRMKTNSFREQCIPAASKPKPSTLSPIQRNTTLLGAVDHMQTKRTGANLCEDVFFRSDIALTTQTESQSIFVSKSPQPSGNSPSPKPKMSTPSISRVQTPVQTGVQEQDRSTWEQQIKNATPSLVGLLQMKERLVGNSSEKIQPALFEMNKRRPNNEKPVTNPERSLTSPAMFKEIHVSSCPTSSKIPDQNPTSSVVRIPFQISNDQGSLSANARHTIRVQSVHDVSENITNTGSPSILNPNPCSTSNVMQTARDQVTVAPERTIHSTPLRVPSPSHQTLERGTPISDVGNVLSSPSSNQQVSHNNAINQTNETGLNTEVDRNPKCDIVGVWLEGMIISCLYIDAADRPGNFCLVEAVCKMYFSDYSVPQFRYVLSDIFRLAILTCTEAEEKAFIAYYCLPVNELKWKELIAFGDLKRSFSQLTIMLKDKNFKTNLIEIMGNDLTRENPVTLTNSASNASSDSALGACVRKSVIKRAFGLQRTGPDKKSKQSVHCIMIALLLKRFVKCAKDAPHSYAMNKSRTKCNCPLSDIVVSFPVQKKTDFLQHYDTNTELGTISERWFEDLTNTKQKEKTKTPALSASPDVSQNSRQLSDLHSSNSLLCAGHYERSLSSTPSCGLLHSQIASQSPITTWLPPLLGDSPDFMCGNGTEGSQPSFVQSLGMNLNDSGLSWSSSMATPPAELAGNVLTETPKEKSNQKDVQRALFTPDHRAINDEAFGRLLTPDNSEVSYGHSVGTNIDTSEYSKCFEVADENSSPKFKRKLAVPSETKNSKFENRLKNSTRDLSISLNSRDEGIDDARLNKRAIRDTLAEFLMSPNSSGKRKKPPSNKRKRKLNCDVLLDDMVPVSTPKKSVHISSILSTGKKNKTKNSNKQVRFAVDAIYSHSDISCNENPCAKKQKCNQLNQINEVQLVNSLMDEPVNETQRLDTISKNMQIEKSQNVIQPHNETTLDIDFPKTVPKIDFESGYRNIKTKTTNNASQIRNMTGNPTDIPDKVRISGHMLCGRLNSLKTRQSKNSDSTNGDELFSQVSPTILDQMCDEAFVTGVKGETDTFSHENGITVLNGKHTLDKIQPTSTTVSLESNRTDRDAKPSCNDTNIDSPISKKQENKTKMLDNLHTPLLSENQANDTTNCDTKTILETFVGSSNTSTADLDTAEQKKVHQGICATPNGGQTLPDSKIKTKGKNTSSDEVFQSFSHLMKTTACLDKEVEKPIEKEGITDEQMNTYSNKLPDESCDLSVPISSAVHDLGLRPEFKCCLKKLATLVNHNAGKPSHIQVAHHVSQSDTIEDIIQTSSGNKADLADEKAEQTKCYLAHFIDDGGDADLVRSTEASAECNKSLSNDTSNGSSISCRMSSVLAVDISIPGNMAVNTDETGKLLSVTGTTESIPENQKCLVIKSKEKILDLRSSEHSVGPNTDLSPTERGFRSGEGGNIVKDEQNLEMAEALPSEVTEGCSMSKQEDLDYGIYRSNQRAKSNIDMDLNGKKPRQQA
ncbi:hypothetical protein ScPMuIL_017972 [Solemya velum]